MRVRRRGAAPNVAAHDDRDADRSIGKTKDVNGTPVKGKKQQSPDAFYRDAVKKPGIRRLMERLAKA
jgi:hypothetical protein